MSFAPVLTETDCAVEGALNGDVISRCPDSKEFEELTSERLRNATGGRGRRGRRDDKREFWARKSKAYHMSGIRKLLHNGGSLLFTLCSFSGPALSSPGLVLRCLVPLLE